jgi:AcrR family transcriptional regulator
MNNKDKIAETTFLLSLKYGFDNVTIKQIQEEAGVTAGAIYYHFKDKNDILLHMIKMYLVNEVKIFKEILENYKGSVAEKLKFIFLYHAGENIENINSSLKISDDRDINHKEYYLFLMGVYHQHPELRDYFHELNMEIFNIYKDLIGESMKNKEIRSDVDLEEIALYIFTIFSGFIEIWTAFPNFSLKKIVDTNIKMICNNIKIVDDKN